MKRKLVRQGHNTLTLSLPRRWCEINKLKEGEEVELSEKLNCLLVSKEAYRGSGEIKVDVSGLDRSTIMLLIQSLYTYGHNLITINSKDSKARHVLGEKDVSMPKIVHDSVNRLVGAEVISSLKGEYKIQVITDDSREKFDVVLRRIFLLITEMFECLEQGIEKRDKEIIENIALQQANVKKFINYSLRILNKFGHEQAEKSNFYFAIINFLGKISEIIKNTAGYTVVEGSLNQSKQACLLIKEIGEEFSRYYDLFYKYDIKKTSELHVERDKFKGRFYKLYKKISKDDVFIVASLMPIADIMLDLIELRMAIGY